MAILYFVLCNTLCLSCTHTHTHTHTHTRWVCICFLPSTGVQACLWKQFPTALSTRTGPQWQHTTGSAYHPPAWTQQSHRLHCRRYCPINLRGKCYQRNTTHPHTHWHTHWHTPTHPHTHTPTYTYTHTCSLIYRTIRCQHHQHKQLQETNFRRRSNHFTC